MGEVVSFERQGFDPRETPIVGMINDYSVRHGGFGDGFVVSDFLRDLELEELDQIADCLDLVMSREGVWRDSVTKDLFISVGMLKDIEGYKVGEEVNHFDLMLTLAGLIALVGMEKRGRMEEAGRYGFGDSRAAMEVFRKHFPQAYIKPVR